MCTSPFYATTLFWATGNIYQILKGNFSGKLYLLFLIVYIINFSLTISNMCASMIVGATMSVGGCPLFWGSEQNSAAIFSL
jgi:hypothetical protein